MPLDPLDPSALLATPEERLQSRLKSAQRQIDRLSRSSLNAARPDVAKLAHTNLLHNAVALSMTVTTVEATIPTLGITFDPAGNPYIVLVSCSLVASPAAASWKQVTIRVYIDGVVVQTQGANLQGNADTQPILIAAGTVDPLFTAAGAKAITATAQVTAENSPADPDPEILAATLDTIVIGRL